MKKIVITLCLILLLPFLCDAQQIIVAKKKGGGACTPSAAGTVLVGSSTTPSADIAYVAIDQQWYFNVDSTATWAGDCTTETVGTLEVYLAGNATGHCKALLANSDGTLLANGISNATNIPDWESDPSWYVFTMGTPPTITKGSNYKIAVVCDMADPIKIPYTDTGTTTFCYDTSHSYASPGTLTCSTYQDDSSTMGGFRGKK